MISHLQQIRKERLNGERGFTLTELLVVIVIIGILVAIAIPVFLSQREAAWSRSAEADARNAIPAIEAFYSNNNAYPLAFVSVGEGGTGPATPPATGGEPIINLSPGVTLTYTISGGVYTIVTAHKDVSTKSWTYDSGTAKLRQTP